MCLVLLANPEIMWYLHLSGRLALVVGCSFALLAVTILLLKKWRDTIEIFPLCKKLSEGWKALLVAMEMPKVSAVVRRVVPMAACFALGYYTSQLRQLNNTYSWEIMVRNRVAPYHYNVVIKGVPYYLEFCQDRPEWPFKNGEVSNITVEDQGACYSLRSSRSVRNDAGQLVRLGVTQ